MTYKESAEYAMHRLCLAKIMKDEPEVRKWQGHVDYWTEQVHDEELKERGRYGKIGGYRILHLV